MQQESQSRPGRRAFLMLLPAGILGGALVTVLTTVIRFLRPASAIASSNWIPVGQVNEIKGDTPIARKILTEQSQGWAITRADRLVYVLPKENKVLSSICPHEGCVVIWQDQTKVFTCPCHESSFGADGARIGGPALRGLDALPTRVQDGTLQVQYQLFVNNTR